jgi:hypothetical protein
MDEGSGEAVQATRLQPWRVIRQPGGESWRAGPGWVGVGARSAAESQCEMLAATVDDGVEVGGQQEVGGVLGASSLLRRWSGEDRFRSTESSSSRRVGVA